MRARDLVSPSAATFAVGLLLVAVVGFADGGYFRESWGPTAIALSCLAGLALLLRDRIELGWLDLATLAALAGVVAWTALSAAWSPHPTETLHEGERGLVYVAALLALVLVVPGRHVRELLSGAAAGVALIAAYALGARLFVDRPPPADPIQETRLIEPLGYANALGALTAIGLLLALGLATHARTRVVRALWAAAPILLLPTLTLTESRATSFALLVGLCALALLDTRRTTLLATGLVVAVPGAAAVWLTWRASALRDASATVDEAADAGRGLALALAALALAGALASLRTEWIEQRLPGSRARWALGGSLAIALAIAVGAAVLGTDRSFGPRVDYWRVAWGQWTENAVLGSGAGTFSDYWRREGMTVDVLDAHSLYVETLAELGPAGLALVLGALGLPLLAAWIGRRNALAGTAAGGYTAYLVHTGLDWDWEMPAVTLTGLVCGAALLAAARDRRKRIAVGRAGRAGLSLAALAIVLLALAGAGARV
jgi:hypothetical protein